MLESSTGFPNWSDSLNGAAGFRAVNSVPKKGSALAVEHPIATIVSSSSAGTSTDFIVSADLAVIENAALSRIRALCSPITHHPITVLPSSSEAVSGLLLFDAALPQVGNRRHCYRYDNAQGNHVPFACRRAEHIRSIHGIRGGAQWCVAVTQIHGDLSEWEPAAESDGAIADEEQVGLGRVRSDRMSSSRKISRQVRPIVGLMKIFIKL